MSILISVAQYKQETKADTHTCTKKKKEKINYGVACLYISMVLHIYIIHIWKSPPKKSNPVYVAYYTSNLNLKEYNQFPNDQFSRFMFKYNYNAQTLFK